MESRVVRIIIIMNIIGVIIAFLTSMIQTNRIINNIKKYSRR
jgi:hypothetical protein